LVSVEASSAGAAGSGLAGAAGVTVLQAARIMAKLMIKTSLTAPDFNIVSSFCR
jgi:hypothetical protein